MRRLGCQLDPLGGERAAHLGDLDRALGDPLGGLRGQRHVAREAPGAVVYHPDGEADVLAVGRSVQPRVAQPHALVPDALYPDVGVLGAQLAGTREGGVGESSQRQVGEGRVYLGGHGGLPVSVGGGLPSGSVGRG
jgi:hypothetical protein